MFSFCISQFKRGSFLPQVPSTVEILAFLKYKYRHRNAVKVFHFENLQYKQLFM